MNEPSAEWRKHAYPLKQITIRLQGTRHSSDESIIKQLETIIARLRAGDVSGYRHDDDFGYSFDFVSSEGPSFFDTDCGSK